LCHWFLAKSFVKEFGSITGESLSRPPKGYDISNEMINYIKMKSFIAEKKISNKLIDSHELKNLIIGYSKLVMPINDFLIRSTSV
jgi:uncharacterized protein (DUF2461 family)